MIAILSAIILPVFTRARERARQANCLLNLKQLGVAFAAYYQDNEEMLPPGFKATDGTHSWTNSGIGWAGALKPYTNAGVFQCTDDETAPVSGAKHGKVVSYAMNSNAAGQNISEFTAPGQTIMCFEVAGDAADIDDATEAVDLQVGALTSIHPGYNSPVGNGRSWVNGGGCDPSVGTCPVLMGAVTGFSSGGVVIPAAGTAPGKLKIAGGNIGNLYPENALPSDFLTVPRHIDGADWLAADGHAVFLKPTLVSTGGDAPSQNCWQDSTIGGSNAANQPTGCSSVGAYTAAGTNGMITAGTKAKLTFSIR